MCLVRLVSLLLLAMQIDDLLSNIIRDACYIITYVSLFMNSLLNILKYDRAITVVHATLYSP